MQKNGRVRSRRISVGFLNETDEVASRAQLVSNGLSFRKSVDGSFLKAASDRVHNMERLALTFGG